MPVSLRLSSSICYLICSSCTRYLMRLLLLILLLPAFAMVDVQAATVDVYTGETAVAGKETRERNRALPEALRHVFQKISGLRSFEDYPLMDLSLEQASDILVSFYYQNVQIPLADGSSVDELRLIAKFSADRVDEIVRGLGLPLWPSQRDSIDIWVVVDDGQGRRIMPVEFSYAWRSMEDVATHRGQPLTWPMPDEEGQYAADTQLLWGGYTEDLGLAPGKGVLIMAARREGLAWGVRSNMDYGSQSWTWRVEDIDLQAALIESLQQAIDLASASSAIAAADQGIWEHQLTITGLNGAGDYERCLAYLQKITVVSDVSVVSGIPGTVTFMLQLNALPRYLEEALLDSKLLGYDEARQQYFLLR